MSVRSVNGRLRVRNRAIASIVAATASVPSPPSSAVDLVTGMIGQSNMVHLSDESGVGGGPGYYATDRRAQRWIGSSFDYIGWSDPTGHVAPGTPYSTWGNSSYAGGMYHSGYSKNGQGQGGDGISMFVNQVTARVNMALKTFEYAVSGSSIQSWMSGQGNWEAFKAAVIASGKTINSVVWLQGEDNANQSTSKVDYKIYLGRLHDQLLALAGLTRATADQFYFSIVILGPGTTYAPEGSMGVIRAAQIEYVAENTGAYIGGIATDANLGGDTIHFNNPSEQTQGARDAMALAAWAKGGRNKWPAPRISGVTNGGTTTTTVHTTASALVDGAGGNGVGALGFRFYAAGGALLTITSSAIQGGNIVFQLSGVAASMDYAMANAPFGGTTSPASVIYDNNTVPGDTHGWPLQPIAALTVTGG